MKSWHSRKLAAFKFTKYVPVPKPIETRIRNAFANRPNVTIGEIADMRKYERLQLPNYGGTCDDYLMKAIYLYRDEQLEEGTIVNTPRHEPEVREANVASIVDDPLTIAKLAQKYKVTTGTMPVGTAITPVVAPTPTPAAEFTGSSHMNDPDLVAMNHAQLRAKVAHLRNELQRYNKINVDLRQELMVIKKRLSDLSRF